MELKEIIKKAKEIALEVLSDRIYDKIVLLEEVESLDGGKWKITLGFYEKGVSRSNFPAALLGDNLIKTYKVLFLDKDGNMEKIKNYD